MFTATSIALYKIFITPKASVFTMNSLPKTPAKCLVAFVCAMPLFPVALFGQEKTPTHPHVSYGSEDRQWLNLYLPSGSEPAPVFIYAHHNGSTADDVKSSALRQIGWT